MVGIMQKSVRFEGTLTKKRQSTCLTFFEGFRLKDYVVLPYLSCLLWKALIAFLRSATSNPGSLFFLMESGDSAFTDVLSLTPEPDRLVRRFDMAIQKEDVSRPRVVVALCGS